MPLASPVTTHEVPELVHVLAPGVEVTVYEVTAAPPSEAGAVQDTVAAPFPGLADTPVGAPGNRPRGDRSRSAADATEVPAVLVAVTVNV